MLDATLKSWIDAIDVRDAPEFIKALARANGLAVMVLDQTSVELELEYDLEPDEWMWLSESEEWLGLHHWVDAGEFIQRAFDAGQRNSDEG
jgi:hypothetical protein